jgi:cytochrome c oxidase subunit II
VLRNRAVSDEANEFARPGRRDYARFHPHRALGDISRRNTLTGKEVVMQKILAASLFMMLALGIAASTGRAQSSGAAKETKEIQMTAKKYEFSPGVIEVAAGTRIVFKITALDREHGFEIAGVKDSCVKIKKGETATVEYLADKPGTVEFKCCVHCGLGHGGMKGKIVVH